MSRRKSTRIRPKWVALFAGVGVVAILVEYGNIITNGFATMIETIITCEGKGLRKHALPYVSIRHRLRGGEAYRWIRQL